MNLLFEDKRSELISKAKQGEKEKTDNKTRYEKRLNSKFSSSTREYNQIDMDSLFRNNILTVKIPVSGETDNYTVTMKFGGFLDLIKKRLAQQGNQKVDLRTILRALSDAFNTDNVYIHCSCDDWKYRMAYFATISDINAGLPENRPSKITNPNNKLGPGCKHSLLVLSNNAWLIKVASVINNYIKYFEQHRQSEYAKTIYPALYGKKYEEPVQTSMFDNNPLESETNLIDRANAEGRVRGRFSSTNQPDRKTSNRGNR